ncbi:unnamed protein product, partial [Arabidopsis halleri]
TKRCRLRKRRRRYRFSRDSDAIIQFRRTEHLQSIRRELCPGVKGVYAADETGVRVTVSFADPSSAKAAREALSGRPCLDVKGRSLHIRYSVLQLASELLMLGLGLASPNGRVQHYGYELCYGTRNVDIKKPLGELPSFVS